MFKSKCRSGLLDFKAHTHPVSETGFNRIHPMTQIMKHWSEFQHEKSY